MDPVTALGAAGSVVGIAAFGVQLSAAIYQVYTEIGDAKQSLQAALDGIDSTALALEKIHEFLQIEERNLKKGRGLLLFSDKAFLGVKDTAHKCLVIFWRIEATITNKSGPRFEQELLNRLLTLKADAKSGTKPPVFALDKSLVETVEFDSYFSVVSLGAIQRSHQQENWKQTAAYNYIRGVAVQGNIHSTAARFSDNRNPEQTSFSILNFGGKEIGSGQVLAKMSSEESLLSGQPNMEQQDERPPRLHDSHKPVTQGHSQPRSGEQMDKDKMVSKGISPQETRGSRGLDRSTSGSRHRSRSMKPPGTSTAHEPGYITPHFDNTDIRFTAGALGGDRKEATRPAVDETTPPHGDRIGSRPGASRPRSVNTEFTSEGSSTAVPEAQTCVYIIKHGISHAIPHRLESGIRDTVNNALRIRPSQKSVYKKIASLSPENIAALQTVLDDGGITPQTRRLVQLSILQKSRFQIGASKDATVLAIVEDLYPQRSWRDYGESTEHNDHSTLRRPSYHGSLHLQNRPTTLGNRFRPSLDEHLGSRGRSRLVKRRFHDDVQDVSKDMMDRDDYVAALTTYRAWTIQKHPSLRQRESEPEDWTKCTVIEDLCNQDAITERIHVLDKKPPSVSIKRLSLRPDQQSQISFLHEGLINDESDAEYQWSLKQIELVRSKSKPFQLVPAVTAIIVYLARTPRANANLQRLFDMQQIPEGHDGRPPYYSIPDGAQPLSAPQPSPHFNHNNPFIGQPRYRRDIRIPSPPPRLWDYDYAPPPPLPPDAPYNPHGPPDGFPPPPPPPPPATRTGYGFINRRGPPPPRPAHPRRSQQREPFSDSSSDSDSLYEASTHYGDNNKRQPKKEETRMIARLVSKRVLSDLGYPWREEGRDIFVLKDLDEDQIEEILKLSEDHRPPEGELNLDAVNQGRARGNAIDDEARLSALQLKEVGRQDRSFERVRVPNHQEHTHTVDANAADHNGPRRLPFRERSLLHDSKLRRKPSDMYLRSSAIARLGIPEAEARVALEANHVLHGLERSMSDFDFAYRRPLYPSQFDTTPYDPQRNADDRIINQLLVEWTPQGVGVPRGDEAANAGVRPEGMAVEELDEFDGDETLSESSAAEDGYNGPSEHSSIRSFVSDLLQRVRTPGAEVNDTVCADQDLRANPNHEGVEEESDSFWREDPTTEIARLEERLATLKSMREGKIASIRPMRKTVDDKAEQSIREGLANASTAQAPPPPRTQEGSATAEGDIGTGTSSPPTQPLIQRRVTMDEVEDEEDTKKLPEHYHPPAEFQDGGDRVDKPARASTFPKTSTTSEAELQWAQRVLEDSTAFSEPTDSVKSDIVFGSASRRSVRAARREASRHREPGPRKLRKAAV